jgi:hypothetical protein
MTWGKTPIFSQIKSNNSAYVVGLPNNSCKPFTNTTWVRARLCKLEKGCTRLAVGSDKVYQLLAHGRWFSPKWTLVLLWAQLIKIYPPTPHICPTYFHNQNITDCSDQKWKGPSFYSNLNVKFYNLLLYPPQRSCRGVYWFHHVHPSVDKSYVVR